MEDHFDEPLPHWAIRKSTGELEVGLQLFTKDGRRTGNAFISSTETIKFARPRGETYVLWECMSDMGNTFKLGEEEVHNQFHLGDYIFDVEEAKQSRGGE